jgi:hypothetical protein
MICITNLRCSSKAKKRKYDMSIYTVQEPVVAIAKPSTFHIKQLFGSLVADPATPTSYSVLSPKNLGDWEAAVRQRIVIPSVWFVGNELAGGHWLHDYGQMHRGRYGWVGGYVMPRWRGKDCFALKQSGWQAIREIYTHSGYDILLSVVYKHNIGAQKWAEHCCGFTPLGVFKDWTFCQGQWVEGVLLTQRQEDRTIAWALAEERAFEFRRLMAGDTSRMSVAA